MDFKAAKRMETFSQYAVAAAKEACVDAGFNIEEEDPYRCGVIIGSGVGSLQQVEKACQTIETKGPQSESAACTDDDLQYGGRQCVNPAWFKRQVY